MDKSKVIKRIHQEIERAGGIGRLAGEWGVSTGYLADVIHGRRAPGPKILKPLGIECVRAVVYREAKR